MAADNSEVPPAIAFNSEFAPIRGAKKGKSGTFAMLDGKPASGGGLIKKGQFTMKFLGPSREVLEKDKLLEQLMGENSLNMPQFKFDKQYVRDLR